MSSTPPLINNDTETFLSANTSSALMSSATVSSPPSKPPPSSTNVEVARPGVEGGVTISEKSTASFLIT